MKLASICDNEDLLIELGWHYKPFIITKQYKKVLFLPDVYKLGFYEYEIVPPNEQLN